MADDKSAPGSPRDLASDYFADEAETARRAIALARSSPEEARRIERAARGLVEAVRASRRTAGGVDALLHEYDLSSEEGVVLMCLAEALLRVPDAATADNLIKDKIGAGDWAKHLGKSESLFVNASTWGLLLTGRVVRLEDASPERLDGYLKRLFARSGEPVIRQAVTQAVRIIGKQFVLGRTIEEALDIAERARPKGYRHSFDMLGESARTTPDALRYLASYAHAIEAVSASVGEGAAVFDAPSVSVKLSALHPRYEFVKRERMLGELLPRLFTLGAAAKAGGVGLTLDAEETERLELSLDLFELLAADASLSGWNGLGLAVQAYQKRALGVLSWLSDLARRTGRRFPVRLVKGAYWDSEIKRAQVGGHPGYPVFTRKIATDTNYLACARFLLAHRDVFYPQIATHNAQTVASVLNFAGTDLGFEFQRLHGMGTALYERILSEDGPRVPVRIYAPVGGHEDLLAYLVRRLLENGANTSFVNRLADDAAPIAEIIADPVESLARLEVKPHPRIPLPKDLYGSQRRNSPGLPLSEPTMAEPLLAAMRAALTDPAKLTAEPLISGRAKTGARRDVRDPADRRRIVGTVAEAGAADVEAAFVAAASAQPAWNRLGADGRARILEAAADLYEANCALLMALVVREGGRTVANAQGEMREAIDFLRYYAARARKEFTPQLLGGPTGERNTLQLEGRGVIAAISPWNFPLAIFIGQIAAALAAGNAVIAKPAEQTPLIGAAAARLLHEAGVPPAVLDFLPGDGAIGARMISDPRLSGVAFTGSTATAALIRRALAEKAGPIVPFIAETGGINAMIVDSTAVPEQAVGDCIASAFDSAGQRCSAARLLLVQDDIADKALAMLAGAMDELEIGDPMDLATDIGPVIDEEARAALSTHIARLKRTARLVRELKLPQGTEHGNFLAPIAFEIDKIEDLTEEIFGPVLHIARFKRQDLDSVCEKLNAKGYGLTLGIHTRIDEVRDRIAAAVHAGNIYVNRNQIGAAVGVQPFGGMGLSGTGPKAGGPHTLSAFAHERTISIDTTAAGGNAALLMLKEER
jgi:RHH-type proline utilization regulon transcriptional repressor/proline dehydrogenase/delta 1-pyrroline-5-carboxylate dehydrogenase